MVELAFQRIRDRLCPQCAVPVLFILTERFKMNDGRFSLGNGRGLVEKNGPDVGGALNGLGTLDKHAERRSASRRGHDGNGCSKSQSARTGNNNDTDAEIERRLHVPRHEQPDKKGDKGDPEHDGHKDGGNFIGKLLNGRLARARLAHHADNGREHGIFAHFLRFDFQVSARNERGAHCTASRRQLDGQTLSRHSRLIGKRVPFEDGAVHCDRFPLLYNKHIPLFHLRKRQHKFLSAALHRDGIGGKREQFFNLPPRAAFALILQPLAERDKRHDHRR